MAVFEDTKYRILDWMAVFEDTKHRILDWMAVFKDTECFIHLITELQLAHKKHIKAVTVQPKVNPHSV